MTNVEQKEPRLWLVGFRFDPNGDGEADLFTIIVDGGRPIMEDGYVIAFAAIAAAREALVRDDDQALYNEPLPTTVDYVYDVGHALYLLSNDDEGADPSGCIVNCLNVLFDILTALGPMWIDHVKDELYPIADHLTFSVDLDEYFAGQRGLRPRIIDAILWGIGAVLTHTSFVRSPLGATISEDNAIGHQVRDND